MVYIVFGVLGLMIGAALHPIPSAFLGMVIGIVAAEIVALRNRLNKIEAGLKHPARETPAADRAETAARPAAEDFGLAAFQADDDSEGPFPEKAERAENDSPFFQHSDDSEQTSTTDTEAVPEPPPPEPSPAAFPILLVEYIKTFFTTGNVVTKIGIIVLFFGVAFLLKYAAQRNMVPIEFRLIGVFLGGLALLAIGWRLKNRKMMYGLLLQGGGLGVLYLTVYAAARFYHLLPYGLSFGVMLCLVILSGILAVLQDAKYMALSGMAGGFLAPVLMSTGSGSHVVLFSYYALLNLGIAGIAWHKAWRELNLTGFVFTFVIASMWGSRYYQPAYFTTTEPFLILFFLYYAFIAVLFALRTTGRLTGYVDGTLVFGTPLVASGLQYALVRDFEYGMAISALCLGLFYMVFSTYLWRRKAIRLQTMTEAFLAFGIVFGSLAIPLALDGRWTSAAWALEGGAILWIGIRQDRIWQRIMGILLQAGSGVSFLASSDLPYRSLPVANSFCIGCMLISLAGLFSGWYLDKKKSSLHAWEQPAAILFMIWGLAWWFGAAFLEIERFAARQNQGTILLFHAAVSFLATDMISRRINWHLFSYPSLLLMPVLGLAGLNHLGRGQNLHLFGDMGWLVWCIAFGIQYRLLFTGEKSWPQNTVPFWHQCTLWIMIFVLTREGVHYGDTLLNLGKTWQACIPAVVPTVFLTTFLAHGRRLSWPVERFPAAYFGWGIALPAIILLIWTALANLQNGNPAPLPYIPIINPVELTQIAVLLLVLQWIVRQRKWFRKERNRLNSDLFRKAVYGLCFLNLNAVVARTVHFYAHVPYSAESLYDSVLFQAALSLLWGVSALAVTLFASRRGSRQGWISGAVILGLVVIKLFIVDLDGTGTVAGIVSFLGVGLLMLLIGYFSPLPPARTPEVS